MNKKLFVLFIVLTIFVVGMSISGVAAKTMTIKLTKMDKYKTKHKGKYKFEAYKFKTYSYQEVDIWGYKNGKWMNKYSYKTKIHYKYGGKWRYSSWMYGTTSDSTYHKYCPMDKKIKVDKIKIKY